MANRQNLIDTYQNNPTLQSRYTQQQYLDLFGFGQSTPTPAPPPPTAPAPPSGPVNIIGQNLDDRGGGIQELQQTFTTGAQPKSTYPRGGIGVDELNQKIYDKMSRDADIFQTSASKFPGEPGYGKAPEYMDKDLFTGLNKYSQEEFMTQNPEYFSQGIPPRTGLLGIKDRVTDFFTDSKFFQPKVQGTLGTRLANAPQFPSFFGAFASSRSPFNKASPTYNPNLVGELNFLEGLGEGMIGRDPNSGHLKYGPDSVLSGKNVISGFGSNSYEVALDNYIGKMKDRGTIDGVYDPENLTPKQLAKLKKAETEKKINTANALKIAEANIQKEKDFVNQLGITAASTQQLTGNVDTGGGKGIASSGVASGKVDPSGMGGGSQKATSEGAQSTGRTDGGWGWADGGRVYLYDRQEMENGGSADDDDYKPSDFSKKVNELMDDGYDFGEAVREAMRQGYNNGGYLGEGDFPRLLLRPGENTGRKKPGLSDYDKDTQDYDYYDDDIIEIPMGKMMKKKTKKKKKKKDRKDYSDGGRVYLYDRQD